MDRSSEIAGFPGNFSAAIADVRRVRPVRSSAADQLPSLGSIRTNVGFLTRGGSMESRIDYTKAAPGAFQAMLGFGKYLDHSGLEPVLLDLVRLRASQINGCAYCLD